MATLVSRISDLATRISAEIKALRTLVNGNAADLSALTTTTKTNLVAALNELRAYTMAIIDDTATSASTSKAWSASKVTTQINAAITSLVNGSPTALDTLKELADALGDDPNFAATMTTALGNRVRVDAAQTFTALQTAQARTNIDAAQASAIGDPDTNYVTIFNTGLT
ncbi:tail fiber protein [Caulobacter phage CcrBL9]|uniref:Tail fiber protein n=1 Tax=Caulobacter phage CcrBL9 TaxID=2283270 RepID=A0A385EBI5_9CAUD|nr:tail fiber protein [Caulobacter phage CcrBL9]AXQ69153.1 tail fiber protein [Caulobacter phage CcrBL9]